MLTYAVLMGWNGSKKSQHEIYDAFCSYGHIMPFFTIQSHFFREMGNRKVGEGVKKGILLNGL